MILNKSKIAVALLPLVAMFACEPMSDVYDELDKGKTAGVVTDIAVTLSEDDYELALPIAESGNDSSSLSSFYNLTDEQARKFIPYILGEKFPQLGIGSSVLVTYDLYQGNSSAVNTYSRASVYLLDKEDYSNVGVTSVELAGYFSPSYPAVDYIPSLLLAEVQDPTEDMVYGVTYKSSDTDPQFDYENAGDQTLYSEGFTTDITAFTVKEVSGDLNVWTYVVFSDGSAQGSGFSSGSAQENEEWLISPEIDLSSVSEAKLHMGHVTRFLNGNAVSDFLNVKISTDYTGDITTATWENVSFPDWVDGGSSNTAVEVEATLDSYAGSKFTLAFAYKSSSTVAPRWQLAEIKVTAPGTVGVIGRSPSTFTDYYAFSSGSWNKDNSAYYLTSADYDAMGAPGQYDNFSSSLPADDYIVKYLSSTAPYSFAQEEEELIVVYKYFSSSAGATQTRGNLYTVVSGSWAAYTSVVATDLLFANEASTWVPDNTIKLTLGSPDYSWIVTATTESNPGGSGNMDTYGNFSCFEWSDEQIFSAITGRLEALFGTPEDGQKYQVTYSIYCGASSEPTLAVIYEGGEWKMQ